MTRKIFFLIVMVCSIHLRAQTGGVSINTNGASPDPSAIIDISSSTKGTLITRMTTAERNAIGNPAQSLMIFNTTTGCFEFYSGGGWAILGCGCVPPDAAGSIYGSSEVCQAQNNVSYSVNSIVNAIGYVWALPPGATIVSGSNTNNIVVNYSSTAVSGNITVYGYSATCGNGAVSANYHVTVNPLPSAASGISGSSIVCQGQNNVSYSVSAINNASSYTWSYSGLGAFISGTASTTSIDFSISSSSGNLMVMGTNACGSGVASVNFPVVVSSLPADAGIISGPSSPCINSQGNVFSINPVSQATSYNWTVPSGATITSDSGTSITVTFGNSSGFISVTPANSCGEGGSNSVEVNLSEIPETPDGISGSTFLASSSGNVYSISPLSNATGYNWTITPSGATITSGQGTSSITVTYPAVTTTYMICVYGSNSCGNSTSSCTSVQVFSGRQAFSSTGSNQNFTVPSGVSQIFVKMWGAGGAGGINYSGGAGAFVSGYLNVTQGSALTVVVGGKGLRSVGTNAAAGGFGGGGASGASNNVNGFVAGSGGGRSSVQITSGVDAATAGGGGGCGTGNSGVADGSYGGGGGNPVGSAGGDNATGLQGGPGAGKGGTTTAGGAATTAVSPAVNSSAGSSLTGSAGGSSAYAGGGGGGGYYGGSGGAGSTNMTVGHSNGGGGGGSSYTANLINAINIAGNYGNQTSNVPAPNNADIDYVSGVGVGGYYSNNGGNGYVVIYW